MPATYQQRILAIPGWIRGSLLLLFLPTGLFLAGYWWWTYSGPYRWLVELQLSLVGYHVPKITFLAMLGLGGAIGVLPPLLLFWVLVKLNLFPVSVEQSLVLPGSADPHWERTHRGRLVGLMVGVMILVAGGILLYVALSVGPLRNVDLVQVEAGQPLPSFHVQTTGRILPPALSQTEGTSTWIYAPLVSDAWQPGTPIRMFVSFTDGHKADVVRGQFKGMVFENGLPGPIRTRYEQQGLLRSGQTHYLLGQGQEPMVHQEMGVACLIAGAVVVLLTVVVWFVIAWREKRAHA